jgi:hypothetical protein
MYSIAEFDSLPESSLAEVPDILSQADKVNVRAEHEQQRNNNLSMIRPRIRIQLYKF